MDAKLLVKHFLQLTKTITDSVKKHRKTKSINAETCKMHKMHIPVLDNFALRSSNKNHWAPLSAQTINGTPKLTSIEQSAIVAKRTAISF